MSGRIYIPGSYDPKTCNHDADMIKVLGVERGGEGWLRMKCCGCGTYLSCNMKNIVPISKTLNTTSKHDNPAEADEVQPGSCP